MIEAMKSGCLQSFLPVLACFAASNVALEAVEPAVSDDVAWFETNIRPLLAERCYSCHSSRSDKREGGLLLDSKAGWSNGGDNGPVIIPGDVVASRLIRAVRYTDPDLQMPPDMALSADEVARLERWVQSGAPDPRDETEIQDTPRGNPSDPIAGRDHWAFQPLIETQPPTIESADWPRTAIDAFAIAALNAADLLPAPDADRRVLARRVYFQLIGLPPTSPQLTEFLEDNRPEAFQLLVDRLLESPQFGERWGRHWLDLARYADSNGLDENFLFREAWRYRNWVINAVNADMPFDRFITEQVAGDLLSYDSIEQRDRQRIAAGFLVVGPKVLLGIDSQKQRMDVADEQLDTVGRAILGQTLGCARCHDHKFDPIPTADYYALAGIFTSTQVMERRYMLGEQRVMERLIGLGPDGDETNGAYETYWRERSKLQEKQKLAKSVLELLEKGDESALGELVRTHTVAIAESAKDASQSNKTRIEAQKALVAELDSAVANPPGIPPRAMIPSEGETPADEHIRLAGQFDRPGEQVPRGVLRVVGDKAITIPEGQSGRLELARWLTDVDGGAGRLTARVIANRLWHHLIGRGIVRTVDNFGRTGEAPSHPELLDHLARELIKSGWSVKTLVRQIVLSRAFGVSSQHDDGSHAVDPENRLLWRAHRRRLDPESLRDAMLSAAGTLDPKRFDSTVDYLGDQATAVGDNKNRRRTDSPCRSVYLPVIRNDLPELFAAFDFADPHATTGLRPQTMMATQGLFMLNDESVMAAAEAVARRLLAEDPSVNAGSAEEKPAAERDATHNAKKMYELVLNAQPDDHELAEMLTFIATMEQRLTAEGETDASLRAWSMACHALFASSRFQILE